ncbi:MAG TPA: phosphoethanolamine transferase domain-containing protein, partial [Moraxellaceae bacterium]
MTVKTEVLARQRSAAQTTWAWRSESVLLLYAVGLVLFYNQAFWSFLLHVTNLPGWHGLLFQGAVFSLLAAFFFLVLSLLPFRWLGRPLLSVLLPLSALAAYFMNQYGTAIDGRMMQNVFETDLREMLDLATLKMALYFLLLGMLPVVLLWCIPLQSPPGWRAALKTRALAIAVAVLVLLLTVGSQYQSIASVARNHKEIRYYLVPNNFIKGIQDYLKDLGGLEQTAGDTLAPTPIARDAHPGASWTGRQRKTLFVLVVGETARAENFGLDGYERNTTPELAQQQGLVNFSHMTSCGTDTAVSLPCMMSGLGREDYSLARARERENLLDVVQRSGIKVLWMDNQSGCKRVCDRVQRINTSEMTDPAFCKDGECHDGILVGQLRHYAETMTQDTLV